MDLQTLRIESKDFNSNSTCTVVMTFELIEFDANSDEDSYCVLHRVQLEPSEYSTLRLDVPLDDSDVREHFEHLLSNHRFGYDVRVGASA